MTYPLFPTIAIIFSRVVLGVAPRRFRAHRRASATGAVVAALRRGGLAQSSGVVPGPQMGARWGPGPPGGLIFGWCPAIRAVANIAVFDVHV
jgi:hypothetical protein